jgi:hypothetical protein
MALGCKPRPADYNYFFAGADYNYFFAGAGLQPAPYYRLVFE